MKRGPSWNRGREDYQEGRPGFGTIISCLILVESTECGVNGPALGVGPMSNSLLRDPTSLRAV